MARTLRANGREQFRPPEKGPGAKLALYTAYDEVRPLYVNSVLAAPQHRQARPALLYPQP
ncbi:MAG: hypothetical protein IVW55_14760 [Chloroflexi bacterium]|nr:hypothetical protein [Chloroflexota bacterium]